MANYYPQDRQKINSINKSKLDMSDSSDFWSDCVADE